MADINKHFDSISDATDYLLNILNENGRNLSDADRTTLACIKRNIKQNLPSIQYAIDLLNGTPKLVTDKYALALACNNLYAQICNFYIICSIGSGNKSRELSTENAISSLNASIAIVYLNRQLTRVIDNLCNGRYR